MISRKLPKRLAKIHNVKDFGAKGDGVTDDTDALIAAYRSGNVYYPPGVYRVTRTIDVSSK